jgi:DNA-binding PadR family transcriptional regulator
VIHSVLDLFILSLLDRGLQTPYDLQRRGGLSLGSAIPALARLEGAGLVRKRDAVGASKRPRHGYKVSAAGLKLARSGWIALLKDPPPSDLDAVLRVIDIAAENNARPTDISSFLNRAARERLTLSKQALKIDGNPGSSLVYGATRKRWDAARLKAEARLLSVLAKSLVVTASKR